MEPAPLAWKDEVGAGEAPGGGPTFRGVAALWPDQRASRHPVPVSTNASLPHRIYHLAVRKEWEGAVERNEAYRRSTFETSLEEEGFIHCSFGDQAQATADRFYRGRADILLLAIDPIRAGAEVRVENLKGGRDLFPHIYGALPLEAVVRFDLVPVADDGTLIVVPLLDDRESNGRSGR